MMYFIIIVLLIALSVSLYFNYRFGMKLLNIEDSLEDCLDTIDQGYEVMAEILSRPLFHDSPEVRKVVEEIKSTKDSLHQMAYSLYENFKEEIEDDVNNVNGKEKD